MSPPDGMGPVLFGVGGAAVSPPAVGRSLDDGTAGGATGSVGAGALVVNAGDGLTTLFARSCSSRATSWEAVDGDDDEVNALSCRRSPYGCRSAARRLSAMLSAKRLW